MRKNVCFFSGIEGIQVSRRMIQNQIASAEWCRNPFEALKRAEVPVQDLPNRQHFDLNVQDCPATPITLSLFQMGWIGRITGIDIWCLLVLHLSTSCSMQFCNRIDFFALQQGFTTYRICSTKVVAKTSFQLQCSSTSILHTATLDDPE